MDNRITRQLCATLKRPLPESKTERIYKYDMDYRCDPRTNRPNTTQTNSLSESKFKAPPKETTKLPPPLSPNLKKKKPSPTVPVTITSTPIDAENIICIEDKTIWAQQAREQRENAVSPPSPPQIAPATAMTDNNEETTVCPTALPEDPDVIKELFQHDKDDDYIQLMSLIAPKTIALSTSRIQHCQNRCVVNSGAYINAISERDAEKLKQDASEGIINKAPHPLSKYSMLMLSWNNHSQRTPYGSKMEITPLKKHSSS